MRKGFTIIELIIVMAIIGIIAAIAIPSFTSYIKYAQARSGIDRIVSDLRFSRQRAVSENVEYKVWFRSSSDPEAPNTYSIYRGNSANGSSSWSPVGNPIDLHKEYKVRIERKDGGDPITFSSPPDSAVFAPDGFMHTATGGRSLGGSIYLIDSRGRGWRIVVNFVGRVRVERL